MELLGKKDDDSSLIASAARLRIALGALDRVAEAGERALVFLDDLTLMSRLTGLLLCRCRFPATPMTINGKIAGAARQPRIDRFEEVQVALTHDDVDAAMGSQV